MQRQSSRSDPTAFHFHGDVAFFRRSPAISIILQMPPNGGRVFENFVTAHVMWCPKIGRMSRSARDVCKIFSELRIRISNLPLEWNDRIELQRTKCGAVNLNSFCMRHEINKI
jgi:hypothetical protein